MSAFSPCSEGRKQREVGCVSSSADLYPHHVVCAGRHFSAYIYMYVLEYVCESLCVYYNLYLYTHLIQVEHKMKDCKHIGQKYCSEYLQLTATGSIRIPEATSLTYVLSVVGAANTATLHMEMREEPLAVRSPTSIVLGQDFLFLLASHTLGQLACKLPEDSPSSTLHLAVLES